MLVPYDKNARSDRKRSCAVDLKFSFSWVGLVIFALPMLINIFYALFPPVQAPASPAHITRGVEITEQVSRIAYLLAVVLLVSREPLHFPDIWLYLAAGFLLLYYAVWIRYFAGGRKTALLRRAFLLIPLPLAVFPVLYFLCAALWLRNLPAAVIMVIFGAAHITVSIQSFSAESEKEMSQENDF